MAPPITSTRRTRFIAEHGREPYYCPNCDLLESSADPVCEQALDGKHLWLDMGQGGSPAGAALAAMRQPKARRCQVCGAAFETVGRGRYCSRACQAKAYRGRQKGQPHA